VPGDGAPGGVERLRLAVLAQPVDQEVVNLQHGQVELGDEQVDVVSRVADEGDPLGIAWQVAGRCVVVGTDQQLGGVAAVEEEGVADRAAAVEALEVGAWGAEVGDVVGVGVLQQQGAVGGDVMGDELAEQGPPRGDGGVVAVAGDQAAVAGAIPPAEVDEERLVGGELRHGGEQAAVLAAGSLEWRVDASRGRQAVVPDDGWVRSGNGHGRSSFGLVRWCGTDARYPGGGHLLVTLGPSGQRNRCQQVNSSVSMDEVTVGSRSP
jgi:hypothetical protein